MFPHRARRRRGHGLGRPHGAALALGLALAGCAAPRPLPPAVTPPPPVTAARHPDPGYDSLLDRPDAIDASGLAGRRIAVDPGHGGFFLGAVGVHGTTEKAVNLAVALKLRDLLAAHGAQVLLTRDVDRDFLTPADSSLRADLAARTKLANDFHPDLFLSIHHNADASGLHDVNETQTYYQLGDDGVSLDAAQDVHRALVHNVGIENNRVVPGNYYVLRTSEAPGLLTETSYITYPPTEDRLATPHGQDIEAGALFAGLARYFARRVPVIEAFAAGDDAAEDSVFARGEPTLSARIRGGCDDVTLLVDGAPVTPARVDSAITWTPEAPLANGPHEARLTARLAGIGAARSNTLRFVLRRAPAELRAIVVAGPGPDRAGAVRFEVLDRVGRRVPDSLRVVVRRTSASGAPAETTVIARDGAAWFHPRLTATRAGAAPRRPGRHAARTAAAGAAFVARVGRGASAISATVRVVPGRPAWTGFVRSMPADTVLRDASGTREPTREIGWLDRDGFAVLPRDAGGARAPSLPGYRAWGAADSLPPRYVAIAGGVLHGRRIVLDPEGGGEDTLRNGPGGTRAAFVNLETARILAGLLRAAGAEVRLTRQGDVAVSDVERVQASEAFRAERFIRIGHRATRARLGYYFSSVPGKRWAERTAGAFPRVGLPEPRFGEDAQYVVQQVSATALFASPSSIVADEAQLGTPGALRQEAWGLFAGLVRDLGGEVEPDSLELHDAAGAPVAGAAITLGGALVVETDALGRARFVRTEPGPLEVRVDDPRAAVRAVLLESSRGSVLTGCCGR